MSYAPKSILDYLFPAEPRPEEPPPAPTLHTCTNTGTTTDGRPPEPCRACGDEYAVNGTAVTVTAIGGGGGGGGGVGGAGGGSGVVELPCGSSPVRGANGSIIGYTVPSIRRVTRGHATAMLARALFETDQDVVELITRVGEQTPLVERIGPTSSRFTWREDRVAVRSATMQRCWDRGAAGHAPEAAWYKRATERAVLVAATLRDP